MNDSLKKWLAAALAMPFIFLALWTTFLLVQRANRQEVKLPIVGYDPRDLLSGHYLQYQIDWAQADCSSFAGGLCPKEAFCPKEGCRFYVPEEKARSLDYLLSTRQNMPAPHFEVIYAYASGREPLAKALLINGQPWEQY